MTPNSSSDLAAKRDRLAHEIRDAEAKLSRLRVSLDQRRQALQRLDASAALTGGDARRPATDDPQS